MKVGVLTEVEEAVAIVNEQFTWWMDFLKWFEYWPFVSFYDIKMAHTLEFVYLLIEDIKLSFFKLNFIIEELL